MEEFILSGALSIAIVSFLAGHELGRFWNRKAVREADARAYRWKDRAYRLMHGLPISGEDETTLRQHKS